MAGNGLIMLAELDHVSDRRLQVVDLPLVRRDHRSRAKKLACLLPYWLAKQHHGGFSDRSSECTPSPFHPKVNHRSSATSGKAVPTELHPKANNRLKNRTNRNSRGFGEAEFVEKLQKE